MPSSRCPHTASTQLSRSSHITATRSHTALTKFPRTKPPCSHHIAPHSNDSSNQLSHSPHTVPTNAASMQSPYRSNTAVKLQQRRCTQPSRSPHAPARRPLAAARSPRAASFTLPSRRPHAALTPLSGCNAALTQLKTAVMPPSHSPHAAARCCSLLPPPTQVGEGRPQPRPVYWVEQLAAAHSRTCCTRQTLALRGTANTLFNSLDSDIASSAPTVTTGCFSCWPLQQAWLGPFCHGSPPDSNQIEFGQWLITATPQ